MGARTQHIDQVQNRHKHPGALAEAYERWEELRETIEEIKKERI
jgi:hypothetical protein